MLESRTKLSMHPCKNSPWSEGVACSQRGLVVVKLLAHPLILPHGPAPGPSLPAFPLCHGQLLGEVACHGPAVPVAG